MTNAAGVKKASNRVLCWQAPMLFNIYILYIKEVRLCRGPGHFTQQVILESVEEGLSEDIYVFKHIHINDRQICARKKVPITHRAVLPDSGPVGN